MRHKVLVPFRETAKVRPYCDVLAAAGLMPVRVSAGDPIPFEAFDGLVLTGGVDVDPELYGQTRQPETDPPDHERDSVESSLLASFLKLDLPVLAICRGHQLLNVFHGGTLVQHLTTASLHDQGNEDRSAPVHSVKVAPGTLLQRVAGAEDLRVNSRHHQGIERLGEGLRACAWATEDGSVEAIERPDRRFVLGVQWHPEDQAATDPGQRRIFESFARAVGAGTGEA